MHYQYEYKYCPVCGGKLDSRRIKTFEPKRLVCRDCEFIFYLDPKLVACSIVETENKIILLKRGIEPQKGKWVVPGGYVDRGEVTEAAAIRETEEECGIKTGIKKLLGVYSYPETTDAIIFYIAEHLSGELVTGDESQEAILSSPKNIPWGDLAFQSTKDALKDYCKLIGVF